MKEHATPRLIQGFLDFVNKSLLDVETPFNTKPFNPLGKPYMSNFKSLNQEFVWRESHDGWVKGRQQLLVFRSLFEKFKASDEKFLVLLTHLAARELNHSISLSALTSAETGIDVTYLSTTTPGGEFISVRLFYFFEKGCIVLARKNNRFTIKLNRLIASNTDCNCLAAIERDCTETMISFLSSQSLIWMQFLAPRNPFLSRSQKFSLLLFNNMEQRDMVHEINRLILCTSFNHFRRKYVSRKSL